MGKFFVRSKETTGPEDWKSVHPRGHWKKGHSAKALAHSWESAQGFPTEVRDVLEGSYLGSLGALIFLRGDVEFEVPLPGGPQGSHNDILVVASSGNQRAVIAVEGKVDEGFGDWVEDWINKSGSEKSGRPERLHFLKRKLRIESKNVDKIRYQLLHRTASAVIEAERSGANYAVLLVHSFSRDNLNVEDYQSFLRLFGKRGRANTVSYLGRNGSIRLYSAWVSGEERFLNV
ncbi:MAG: hypothetical protein J4G01_01095 [Dehalococcoidia bacterium]|nr:hypothetical protein [Dehalococcoidia bacterium]